MGVIDPKVLSLLATAAHRRGLVAEGKLPPDAVDPLPEWAGVIVKCTGPIEDLAAAGLTVGNVLANPAGWSIVTGRVRLARIEALAAVPHVTKIEVGGALGLELDTSVAEIHARQLHTQASPLTGKDVVVGVIDSDIDFQHPSFRKSDGSTRIKFLWDQALTITGTEQAPPEHPTVGVEYTDDHIKTALASSNPLALVRSTHDTGDEDKHGSHVTGIAAGDGSQAGNCKGANTFVGVAPDADIIFVKLRAANNALGASQNLLDAILYIIKRARKDNPARACVINISQGDNLGPHDGTSLVERGIDTILQAGAGVSIIKSAGNEGDKRRHAFATVPPTNSVSITFEAQDTTEDSNRFIDCWYAGAARLDVTLTAPTVPARTTPPVPSGTTLTPPWVANPAAPAAGQTTVTIASTLNDTENHDNRIFIGLTTPVNTAVLKDTWTLTFTNPNAAPVDVHCWIERGTDTPRFTSHASNGHTISIPGTARHVISVGSYGDKPFALPDGTTAPSGTLANSSSRGPTRDGRQKPEICAPGVNIISAKGAATAGCCCDCCYTIYHGSSGTSMAAPHVCGVVALMLQLTPGLTNQEIRNALALSARMPDPLQGTPPNNDWGAGMVDANAAVALAAAAHPVPPGGGGGGGGGGGPIPYWTPPVDSPHDRTLVRRLHRFQQWLMSFPAGQQYAELVSRHFDEVFALINTNKRVATVWHRNHGPMLVQVGLGILDDPEHASLPTTIGGAPASDVFDAILSSWRRHGSPALATDIDEHREALLALPGVGLVELLTRATQVA